MPCPSIVLVVPFCKRHSAIPLEQTIENRTNRRVKSSLGWLVLEVESEETE